LKGKKLGVAGGKLDKSWLIMQGFSRIIQRWDIAEETEVVYAAPPLLNEKLKSGELDAVLNYWHWCARLESLGYPFVISVAAAMEALAVPATTPQLGYVMHESWAAANRSTVQAFARASRAANKILQASDEEWQRLRPLIRAESDAVLDLLMYRYREGIVQAWGEFERERAAVLYAYLAKQGGADLVGRATELAPGTFWADVTF
jgi:NitT/TauT family transport system substrate-binding protein